MKKIKLLIEVEVDDDVQSNDIADVITSTFPMQCDISLFKEASGINSAIINELMEIMCEYHRQEKRGNIDTPGGLEHMGDVWNLLGRWESTVLKNNKERHV